MRALFKVHFPLHLKAAVTALSAVGAVFTAGAFSAAPYAAASVTAPPALAARNAPAALPVHTALPVSVTVLKGDTLSKISARVCGTSFDWSGLYRENRAEFPGGPDAIETGQVLKVHCYDPGYTYPKPKAVHEAAAVRQPVHAASAASTPSRAAAPAATVTYSGSGSVQQCIIRAESGGNPNVFNASGHYGLYQFSEQTWVGSGGSAADFGHASVAEQNQVFANAVAARGYSDWRPYDGC